VLRLLELQPAELGELVQVRVHSLFWHIARALGRAVVAAARTHTATQSPRRRRWTRRSRCHAAGLV
jgi:hypothetical protein